MRYYRPTWAEIDLDNLAYNLKQVKKLLSPGTKVMVTVKADAYGHGLVPVSKRLVSCRVDSLGVASIDEGIRLREAGIKIPILILGIILAKDIPTVNKNGLSVTVCEEGLALALNKKSAERGRPVKVHVKVDTGMGRIGVQHQDALALIKRISELKFIDLEGIFTHFPLADTDKDFTLRQIEIFARLAERLKGLGINIPLVHAANSLGALNYKKSHFSMIRPGLVIYGLYPAKNLKIRLKPVLSLKTRVMFIKRLPRGRGVSYGHDYVTQKETTIVTLPLGYGDGYPRNLSGVAPVLIKGMRFKISGRICMDQIMVDVGNARVRIGDEAVLIGAQGEERISVEELACLSGTIPYEIVCGLGSRIPRVYKHKTRGVC